MSQNKQIIILNFYIFLWELCVRSAWERKSSVNKCQRTEVDEN